MDQVYQNHFGFRIAPFNITPDPGFLFMTESHKEALAQLSYGIKARKGFVVVTGEVGTGKTTLIKALLNEVSESTQTAFLFSLIVSAEDLLRYICEEFGIVEPRHAATDLHDYIRRLNDFLLERYKAGRNCALIIDEAQNLSNDVLEAIRLLSNFETARDKLLQIVLVGQPELTERLNSPALRQLKQRITLRHHLRTLTLRDCKGYIAHRVQLAGGDPGIFTPAAAEAFYKYSAGIPRLVNVLCDNALLAAYALGQKQIDAPVVREVAADLHLTTQAEPPEIAPALRQASNPAPDEDSNGRQSVEREARGDSGVRLEPARLGDPLGAMKDFLRAVPESGTVPETKVAALVAALTEAIGPMAPLVLRDVVSSMGETESRFPRAKLTQLLDIVSQEIVDEGMRKDFQKVVSGIMAR